MRKVVVTGIGIVSPLGSTIEEFWNRLVAGESGVVALEDEMYSRFPTRIGAVAAGYRDEDHFGGKEARRLSRATRLGIAAASEAIKQAGLEDSSVDRRSVGVVIGSSIGGFSASDPLFEDFYVNGRYGPLTIPFSMNSGPSSQVSLRHGFQGPVMSVDAACASSGHSIGLTYNLIRWGQLDVGVTGGADCPFSPGVLAGWCALRVLSARNEEPSSACRPFSADRDGMVLGEGAAVLVLESESSARRRGAQILAEICGYAAASDGVHLTRPTVEGAARTMALALADAGIRPEDVDYVNAHGTGTRLNDSTETSAIKRVFGEHADTMPVVSNKGALGHSIGGSGAIELAICILSLRRHMVPPTINYQLKDSECDLDYVTTGARPLNAKTVMSNSFAFGGSNAVLIVREPGTES